MSVLGRWRIVEMPDYIDDYRDMMEPAYILFEATHGDFAFGCITGSFAGGGDHDAVQFDWVGNDEMDETQGTDGLNSNPTDPSRAKFVFQGGDEVNFIARRETSSTAC